MAWSGPLPPSQFSSSTIFLFKPCIQVLSVLLTLDLSLTMTCLNCQGFSYLLAFSLITFSSWKVIHLPPILSKITSYFKTLPNAPDSTYTQASHLLLCSLTTRGKPLFTLITGYYNCYSVELSCILHSKFLDDKS